MNFQQVRDILKRVRERHRQFREILATAEQYISDARLQQIADEMRQHEQHWEAALARYRDDAENAVLELWIQYVPDETVFRQLEEIQVTADVTIDELIDAVVQFREALISLYSTLSTSVSAPHAQLLFALLLEMEKSTLQQSVWRMRTPYV
ncbi:MAG: hypothetical protein KDB01_07565 [Planctomycetaceae bacterium]|nr:hypothetical protein [Planctomycetaceae bacterium]